MSFFEGIKPLITDSDYFILNLETVLEKNPKPVLEGKNYPNYDNPKRTLKVLKNLGVTAVGLANNHTMDFGPKVLGKTLKRLEKANIKTFGAGKNIKEASKPLKITLKGRKSKKNIYIFTGMRAGKRYRDYGFFAENKKPGVNRLPQKGLSRQISNIRRKDPKSIIIVYPHWQGQDYKWASNNARIQDRCRALIDAGANFIFGHGTHMLNDIEHYNGGTIAYSIGNFVFNSPGRYKKMQAPPYSLLVNMEILEKEDGDWIVKNKFYPIKTDNKSTGYKVEPLINNEKRYIELGESGESQYKRYNLLNELKIDGKLNKPTKKVKSFSTHKVLAEEFKTYDIKTKIIEGFLVAYINGKPIYFNETRPSTDSQLGTTFAKNKRLTRLLLEEKGLSVARGKVFGREQQKEAFEYTKNFKATVIKPIAGHKGKGVSVGVTTEQEFLAAWEECKNNSKGDILIEEEFTGGKELRYLVVGGKYTASILRIPPTVVGNGIDTVEKLIQKKNKQRALNQNLVHRLIKLDKYRLSLIEKQGYQLQDVPEKDKKVLIDSKAGLSTGGESMDMTDEVHESFKRIAERAAKALPGLDVVGVDLLAKDHLKSATENNYIIVEVNTKPGIGGHHHPVHGTSRNVAKYIVEHVISKVQKNNLY